MEAIREGRQPAPPTDDLAKSIRSLFMTMMTDADLFRAALEYIGTLTPAQEILKRPEVVDRIRAAQEAMKSAPPMPMPGPNRSQLLELAWWDGARSTSLPLRNPTPNGGSKLPAFIQRRIAGLVHRGLKHAPGCK